ncbi:MULTISPECIES: DeoR/GlpR family DNA-binding transcription regulator [Bacillus]|uniref:DeoR faimly transcriptional regulator n=2 Tax=Bacillus TaxID=1386 RepID=A0A0M4FI68_9BACI|nr:MULTISPECIES: DeoR/GlpR family DNA-binding transcription regulator [Bacillus]ALC80904.1 DeoR faimly transcriptional regulator [Bacillus gobiensis]MBP1079845.1 DeoR family fructose operon transcriptional repressor [Bacillus capparidis]MED1095234.1 DeoR/GlpR family DNA-binding transcription regulator [Bacillus capparidis]
MLTQERHQVILDEVQLNDVVALQRLVQLTNASESTIRRDLTTLEERGFIKRVHGGASKLSDIRTEPDMQEKSFKNLQDKQEIAREAAKHVGIDECIYLDAGTTTHQMIQFLDKANNVLVVTNGVMHIEELSKKGIPFYILGGAVKHRTGAIMGGYALLSLEQYRFDKCFLGTNGIHLEAGFTTPDPEEAIIKKKAAGQSKKAYVLADPSKFGEISFSSFAPISKAAIVTTNLDQDLYRTYNKKTEVKVVNT